MGCEVLNTKLDVFLAKNQYTYSKEIIGFYGFYTYGLSSYLNAQMLINYLWVDLVDQSYLKVQCLLIQIWLSFSFQN